MDSFATYEDYLDNQVTPVDMYYLENEQMARQLVELGYRGEGEILGARSLTSRKEAMYVVISAEGEQEAEEAGERGEGSAEQAFAQGARAEGRGCADGQVDDDHSRARLQRQGPRDRRIPRLRAPAEDDRFRGGFRREEVAAAQTGRPLLLQLADHDVDQSLDPKLDRSSPTTNAG